MMPQPFLLPILYLFAPLAVALFGLLGEKTGVRNLRETAAVLISALGLVAIFSLYQQLSSTPDGILVVALTALPPLGASLEVDMLGIYMAFSVALLSFFATLYSFRYMEHDTRLTEYYTLLSSMTVGIIGVAFAGDFFTLFIFWELMSISSYVLVAFRKERPEPIEAGFKYLVMSALGSAIIFLGMAILYGMAGTVNFAHIADVLRINPQPLNLWLMLLFGIFIVGFGIKAAIVPMHTWLPDAHPEAPSPISAMLSGMLIETGLYALTRVLFITFDPSTFRVAIAALAVLTMSFANLLALLQQDIKRMLAYSSIAQMGYMLVGLSVGTTFGMLGLFLHVFNHSLMKGLAFLSSGSIVHVTGTRDIGKLKGVGRAMPITTFTLFVAFLGLGGVPSTSGFVSKFILFGSTLEVGMWWLMLAGVLNSAFSMAYYLRVMKTLISVSAGEFGGVREAPGLMLAVTVIMASLIIIFGLWFTPTIEFADRASRALVEGLQNYWGAVFS